MPCGFMCEHGISITHIHTKEKFILFQVLFGKIYRAQNFGYIALRTRPILVSVKLY